MERKRKRLLAAVFPAVLAALIGAVVLLERTIASYSGKDHVRIALCQYETRLGDLEWNFDNAMRAANEAVRHGADVIVFPEFSFVAALDLKDGVGWFNFKKKKNWHRRVRSFVRRHRVYLFLNHPAVVANGAVTNRFNQTQVFGPKGSTIASYWKRFPSIMDFSFGIAPGDRPVIAELPFAKIGLMTCKDSWYMDKFPQYADADLVVIQFAYLTCWGDAAAMPRGFREQSRDSSETFHTLVTNGIPHLRRPLLLCNKSGLEGECLYNGLSAIVDSSGNFVHRAPTGTDIVYADIRLDKSGRVTGEPEYAGHSVAAGKN